MLPPLLRKARENPLRLYDGYAQLQCPLVLNSRTRDASSTPTNLSGRGSYSRGGAYEVGCVDLDFIAPTRIHLIQSSLCLLQKIWVLDCPETHTDPGRVRSSMCLNADEV